MYIHNNTYSAKFKDMYMLHICNNINRCVLVTGLHSMTHL